MEFLTGLYIETDRPNLESIRERTQELDEISRTVFSRDVAALRRSTGVTDPDVISLVSVAFNI